MSDNSDAGKPNDKPDPQGLTDKQKEFLEKQIQEQERKKAKEEADKLFAKMTSKEAIAQLQKENEQLKAQQQEAEAAQRAIMLKQLNSDEQEEYKDCSITELQLLLDYKAKYLKRGIQRSASSDASNKRTSTKLPPGSIGSWDPISRTWK
jgi:hypothetical protein